MFNWLRTKLRKWLGVDEAYAAAVLAGSKSAGIDQLARDAIAEQGKSFQAQVASATAWGMKAEKRIDEKIHDHSLRLMKLEEPDLQGQINHAIKARLDGLTTRVTKLEKPPRTKAKK